MLFDGSNKLIILETSDGNSVSIQDMYSDWKQWLLLSDNSKFLPAFQALGGEPIGTGLFTGSTFFLINSWLIRPREADHILTLTGNLFGEEGAAIITPTLGDFSVAIQYRNSALSQGIATSGGSGGLTPSQESKLNEIHSTVTNSNGITANLNGQQAMLLWEIYAILGLDPTKPLIVSRTNRSVGTDINQTISRDAQGTVTVDRV